MGSPRWPVRNPTQHDRKRARSFSGEIRISEVSAYGASPHAPRHSGVRHGVSLRHLGIFPGGLDIDLAELFVFNEARALGHQIGTLVVFGEGHPVSLRPYNPSLPLEFKIHHSISNSPAGISQQSLRDSVPKPRVAATTPLPWEIRPASANPIGVASTINGFWKPLAHEHFLPADLK